MEENSGLFFTGRAGLPETNSPLPFQTTSPETQSLFLRTVNTVPAAAIAITPNNTR